MNRSSLLRGLGLTLLLAPFVGAQTNLPVSVSSSGNLANNNSYYSLISADGRYVVFQSEASNLVTGDFNGQYDIFRRDLATGTTELVSVSMSGISANGLGLSPAVSGDGRLVVWSSNASNLVPGDTNGNWDVFLRDMDNGVTTRISVDQAGNQIAERSDGPRMSPDARYVVFESDGPLLTSDTNGTKDCYRLDRTTGTLTQVSVTAAGVQGNDWSYHPQISHDGRYVVFTSGATNLAAADTNSTVDIFRKDLQTGDLERVNVSTLGAQADGESTWPSISGDGQTITYCSRADNLVPSDNNNDWDLFARNMILGQTRRLNLTPNGNQANSYVRSPTAVSSDGRYVIFASLSTNLVPGDTNGFQDIFLRDRELNVTTRVSVNNTGGELNDDNFVPDMTPDAQTITFTSEASDVVTGDTNGRRDIFAAVLSEGIGTSYCGPAVPNSTGASGVLAVTGSTSAAANNVTLTASDLPMNQFSYFLNSLTQGFVQNPGFSQGDLCLAGDIGRYNPAEGYVLQNTGTSGSISLTIDLTSTPTPTGPVSILAGETWNFQCWYRDLNPMATTNFTQAVSVPFQ